MGPSSETDVFGREPSPWGTSFSSVEDLMMSEIGYPFHTDPVVTDQFFGNFSSPGPVAPEKELLIAILADAIECYRKYSTSRNNVEVKLFQEAREWIFAENEDAPLAFVNVCDTLTLDPNYLRQRLLAYASSGFRRGRKKLDNPIINTKSIPRGKKRSGTKRSVRRGRRSHSK